MLSGIMGSSRKRMSMASKMRISHMTERDFTRGRRRGKLCLFTSVEG